MKKRNTRVSVKKLKESDIYLNNAVKFIDQDGVIVELEKSWKEILIALITCINSVRGNRPLVDILSDLKLFNGNLLITKGYVENHQFKDNDSYKIDGSNYYIMCDYTSVEYLKAIKNICKYLKFSDKDCFIEMESKKGTEQDVNIEENESSTKLTRIILLRDMGTAELSKVRILGVLIKNNRYECKSIIGAIKLIVMTDITKVSKLYSLNGDKLNFKLGADGVEIEHKLERSDLIALLFKICNIYNIKTYELGLIVR